MSSPAGADLLVRLYELRLREPYRSASRWLEREFAITSWLELEARHPRGSDGHELLRLVLEHWELIGALVRSGALDEALLFDSTGEHLSVWERVAPWIEEARRELADPELFVNLQILVERHEQWQRGTPPRRARRVAGQP